METEKEAAILLHKKWPKRVSSFTDLCDRCFWADVDVGHKRFRFVSVYMPDTSCHDSGVEDMSHMSSDVKKQCERQSRMFVVGKGISKQFRGVGVLPARLRWRAWPGKADRMWGAAGSVAFAGNVISYKHVLHAQEGGSGRTIMPTAIDRLVVSVLMIQLGE